MDQGWMVCGMDMVGCLHGLGWTGFGHGWLYGLDWTGHGWLYGLDLDGMPALAWTWT
jgi:hypothetical protein